MNGQVRIKLLPLGKTLTVERGTALLDILFAEGVEFPCGGRGRCKGCRIKVRAGTLPVSTEDEQRLGKSELAEGWRLACSATASADITIELAQWQMPILTDETKFEFAPQDGFGLAIDLGTTTIVAQLIDLRAGHVLGVRTALNAQARHGADVMSRIEFACAGGAPQLARIVRDQLGALASELVAEAIPTTNLKHIVIVGNTVMHHLFCGLSVEPLAHYPFEPTATDTQMFSALELGWDLPGNPPVHFLPCLGGFIGSDLLAGILATKLHRAELPAALIDLGTNGEIVIGNRQKILCASTAAGPAFEGARISFGMRAATGAISEVHIQNGRPHCQVLGNVKPRGICGSGLVDAVACGLDLGIIRPDGRLETGDTWVLCPPVYLTQKDFRELQLAKAAIAAGLQLVAQRWGIAPERLDRVFIAGAFGNYIRLGSARRIGLIRLPTEMVKPVGNTALLGAKLALFGAEPHKFAFDELRQKITHVALNKEPQFEDMFAAQMHFPAHAQ